MPETPRTWTLNFENSMFFPLANGTARDRRIRVYEASTVDAERERLLDLLDERHNSPDWDEDVSARVEVVLREYDRLGKGES